MHLNKIMIKLTNKPIDVAELLAYAEDEGSGGVVVFLGRVRNHSNGQKVIALEYEAYEAMALRQMEKIAEETAQRWPVRKLAIAHRFGRMEIGEVSVAIVAACAHRADAFAACRFAIDTIKHAVPIWKKEYRPDGSFWVEGCQAHGVASEVHHSNHQREEVRV